MKKKEHDLEPLNTQTIQYNTEIRNLILSKKKNLIRKSRFGKKKSETNDIKNVDIYPSVRD